MERPTITTTGAEFTNLILDQEKIHRQWQAAISETVRPLIMTIQMMIETKLGDMHMTIRGAQFDELTSTLGYKGSYKWIDISLTNEEGRFEVAAPHISIQRSCMD